MPPYKVFIHVRHQKDGADVHTDAFEANPRFTFNLLRVIDPAVARKFAKTYDLNPEDTIWD